VTTVLCVIPSLDFCGLARRLTLVAAHLPRERFQLRVVALGGPSPGGKALRNAGIAVDELGWQRPFDARPLLALRRIATDVRPDFVHAWGARALWAALAAGLAGPRRLVASGVLAPIQEPGRPGRWLLRMVGCVVAFGRVEAERYRRLGVPAEHLVEAPIGHDPAWPPATPEGPSSPQIAYGRVLLGVGPLIGHKGFRDAVWSFDILNMLYDDVRLVIAGDGPDRSRIENFVRVTGTHRRVHCVGPVDELTPLRHRALVAWVLGRAGGVQAALESMSAGLPVVASRTPRLAEVVVHGETGFLTAPGDNADVARQTRRLLEDEAVRRAFGEAGRRRVAERFPPGPMANACAEAYLRYGAR
jgi:glycosyltransferase involved in cell wall biosynthesis